MRVSFNQLKEMVDFPYTPSQLAENLTMIGLEVKRVEAVGQLKGVVVGKILEVKDHPNADKLKIVKVDTGKKILPLVCGAPNVEEGKFVAVAFEGAQLPGNVRVKKVKIRGVNSPGMICSERELGLGEDHSGVMIFPSHLPLGDKLSHALGLEDYVLDLEVTPNRGDCFSILGIAREVAALIGGELRVPSCHIKKEDTIREKNLPSIHIKDPDLCSFYGARVIKGVKVAPSPLWLRWKILLSGAKPVNNVVDVTNYVMWEMGEPLHPFDLDTLTGSQIVIRRAKQGEILFTLDNKQRRLSRDMLVIADAKNCVALAGIMGGGETETKPTSKNIFLEAAYFNPVSVGKTSRKLGLSSEASTRFERGVDPAVVKKALDRASYLIQKIAGGEVVDPLLEEGELPLKRRKIYFRPSRVMRITGLRISSVTSKKILLSLGFKIREDKGRWEVHVPTHRGDVEREIDLVEEVARIYGYNKIGMSLPQLGAGGGKEEDREGVKSSLRSLLAGCGFYEVITPPLVGEKLLLTIKEPADKTPGIRNPLSLEQKFLRPYLSPQILEVASFNYSQEAKSLRLMETGKVFTKGKKGWKENSCLAGVVVEGTFDFYRVKGIVEVIFEKLRIEGVKFHPSYFPYLHEAESALIKKGKDTVGFMGKLNPELSEQLKLLPQTYLFELNLDLVASLSGEEEKYQPLPRFPSVKRDLSIVIREDIPAEDVREYIIKKAEHVEKVKFFDFYQGAHVPSGHKSISFSLIFRHPERTLTDDEVNAIQSRIISSLEDKWGASLRKK